MRCLTRGVYAGGRLIALRGGRLRDEDWNGASCTAAAEGRFRDGWCGVPHMLWTAAQSMLYSGSLLRSTGGRICLLVQFACRVYNKSSSLTLSSQEVPGGELAAALSHRCP
jgi:hypothetical protein